MVDLWFVTQMLLNSSGHLERLFMRGVGTSNPLPEDGAGGRGRGMGWLCEHRCGHHPIDRPLIHCIWPTAVAGLLCTGWLPWQPGFDAARAPNTLLSSPREAFLSWAAPSSSSRAVVGLKLINLELEGSGLLVLGWRDSCAPNLRRMSLKGRTICLLGSNTCCVVYLHL